MPLPPALQALSSLGTANLRKIQGTRGGLAREAYQAAGFSPTEVANIFAAPDVATRAVPSSTPKTVSSQIAPVDLMNAAVPTSSTVVPASAPVTPAPTPVVPSSSPAGTTSGIVNPLANLFPFLSGNNRGIEVDPASTSFARGPNGMKIAGINLNIDVPLQSSGRYRQAIEGALRNAGVAQSSINMLLAKYDSTPDGQAESPGSSAGSELTNRMLDWIASRYETPTNVTGDSLNQRYAKLFTRNDTTASPELPQNGGVLDPASIATMFNRTMTGSGQDGVAASTDAMAEALTNYRNLPPNILSALGMSDGQDTQGGAIRNILAGADSQTREDILDAITGGAEVPFPESSQILQGGYGGNPVNNFANSMVANQGGSTTLLNNVSSNLFGVTGGKELTDALFGDNLSFEQIRDSVAEGNIDSEMALYMSQALGERNVGVLQTLLSTAENERQFNEAMRQFDASLKLEKQNQQITVLNSMMDMTLSQMQLDQTAQNNLMNAQIAAMNTALKSKELTQAEQADIRQNLLNVVDLELQEKRINNDQANFLTNTLLATQDLALRVRELDLRGEIAEADRELEREGMNLSERLGLTQVTADILNRAADRALSREGLELERELGFANIGQRESEAALNAEVALLNAAMANPYSYAALSSLGGLGGGPGMQGAAAPAAGGMGALTPAAAGPPPQLFPGLTDIGFRLPPAARPGVVTPAPQFFTGGMPTLGALSELDPASRAFLQNILGFSGTSPEGLERGAGEVTPFTGNYAGLGRTLYG
jgi:hypothetical protein